MDINEVIKFLKQYQNLKLRLKFLKSNFYGIKAVRYDSTPMAGGEKPTIVDKLSDIDEVQKSMDEIQKVVSSSSILTYRIVLTYVYIDGLTLQFIADRNLMGYSYRQLRRLHHDAVDHLIASADGEVASILEKNT